MSEINPIETIYKGIRFKSMSEARWAVLFDAMGMKYVYEPQEHGIFFRPNFYLPDARQYFTVLDILTHEDKIRINRFISSNKRPVNVGYGDFTFCACDNYEDGYALEEKTESILMKCNKCGKYFFLGSCGGWECTCCGYYDGDDTSQWISTGDLNMEYVISEKYEKTKFKKAVEKARQIRFDGGESGMNGR